MDNHVADRRNTTRDDLARIYHQLKVGTGHELVNDGNVQQLIRMADEYGDTTVATILREWQSPCGNADDDNAR